jgi:mono/diheme cytochrome c family protein
MLKAIANIAGMALATAVCIRGLSLNAASSSTVRPVAAAHQQRPLILAEPSAESGQRALLDRYCVTCHNEKLRTAGLTLDTMELTRVGDSAHVWEKVVRKLRAGAMPPPGVPRPEKPSIDALTSWLESALDRAAASRPDPGRPTIHRLNRVEYTNAIRYFLALEVDGRALLPPDNAGYGFDNIADVLSVSPGLMERYLSAARNIGRLAVGDPTIRPVIETYKVSPVLVQEDQLGEDFPFGTRGGTAIRHNFPLDGEYVIKIRLQRTYAGGDIRGISEREQLDVRLDGVRIKLLVIGGETKEKRPAREQRPSAAPYASEYARTADAGLEVRFAAKAGARLVTAAFVKKASAPEGVRPAHYPVGSFSFAQDSAAPLSVESVQIGGPFDAAPSGDSPSRREIFVCRPTARHEEAACARQILGRLARRAYRRPVSAEEVRTLLSFYESGRSEDGFERGIESALERILIDPNFLFRIEDDPKNGGPNRAYPVSGLEVAARLSFFLWSSIPDDELLTAAESGKLKDSAILEQQVRRMLASPKANALVTNFGGQWLYVRNMRGVTPDPNVFPEFDDNLREAMQRETELFIESLIRDDRPAIDLLTANYTFLNERLARHYGIPNVYGNHFRRVTFSDERRAGLLGQGSILTVTSYATRTSPVLRGKWLLENILGSPPPPPPPNVPALKENKEDGTNLSVRERMEQHRKNPVCASCHSRMDPLGFALENFNAVGQWRETSEAGKPVDASGTFPDGTRFDGPAQFRRALTDRRDELVTTITEKLLTYALGRGLEYYDAPAVRKIVREAASTDFSWRALILGVVKSMPFQMRRSQQWPS